MTDEDIPQLFNLALPPDPDTSTWANQTRDRVRRRRVAGAVVVVLATVAAVVPLALQFQGGREAEPLSPTSAVTSANPIPSATATPSQMTPTPAKDEVVNPCIALGEALTENPKNMLAENLSAGLPDGAQRIWMCGRADLGIYGEAAPAEPLTTEVAETVALLNQRFNYPWVDDPTNTCASTDTHSYTLIIDYPQGPRYVFAERDGCGIIGDTSTNQWTGGKELFEALVTRFAQQRAASPPPETTIDESSAEQVCTPMTSLVKPDLTGLVRGAFCGIDDEGALMGVVIPADLVAKIEAEWRAGLTPATEPAADVPNTYMVFHDGWGSAVQVWSEDNGTYLVNTGDGHGSIWRPSAEVELALKDIFTNHEWTAR